MNSREYEIMSALEAEHWWYVGLRQRLISSLRRFGQRLSAAPSILDAGCGTGENLRFLSQQISPQCIGGFDNSPQAVRFARNKNPTADIYCSDICNPELHDNVYDVVISCDVLYIPGLEASFAGLNKIVQRLSSGGLLLLNLPAYNWLRSDHDLAIHTHQRFVASELRQLMRRLDLQTCCLTYRLCPLFPLVVASRLPSILCPSRDASQVKSALRKPSQFANFCFGKVMKAENRLIDAGVSMPWGSSVFAVGRRL